MPNATLPPFEIFRPGKHRTSDGRVIEFSEAQVAQAIAAYDPALSEAPLTVGHPKTNAPAFGWVGKMTLGAGGAVVAEPRQVQADFAEAVAEGRYKKRSASWYLPDHPCNPKPGTLYLRHVAFLGAAPPSIKGLADIEFSEGDEGGIIEFEEGGCCGTCRCSQPAGTTSGCYCECCTKSNSGCCCNCCKCAATCACGSKGDGSSAEPADLSEGPVTPPPVPAPPPEDLAQIEARQAELDRRQAELDRRDAELRSKEIAAFVEGCIQDARIPPGQKDEWIKHLMGLQGPGTADFAEGESPLEKAKALLASLPRIIDLGEVAGPGAGGIVDFEDPIAISRAIVEFQLSEAKSGRDLSYAEALMRIRGNR